MGAPTEQAEATATMVEVAAAVEGVEEATGEVVIMGGTCREGSPGAGEDPEGEASALGRARDKATGTRPSCV